jgi:hypothetical protein
MLLRQLLVEPIAATVSHDREHHRQEHWWNNEDENATTKCLNESLSGACRLGITESASLRDKGSRGNKAKQKYQNGNESDEPPGYAQSPHCGGPP